MCPKGGESGRKGRPFMSDESHGVIHKTERSNFRYVGAVVGTRKVAWSFKNGQAIKTSHDDFSHTLHCQYPSGHDWAGFGLVPERLLGGPVSEHWRVCDGRLKGGESGRKGRPFLLSGTWPRSPLGFQSCPQTWASSPNRHPCGTSERRSNLKGASSRHGHRPCFSPF